MTESRVRAMLELAERCEREAENWHGQSMHDGLLDIAKRIRARAADTPKVTSDDR